jgi:nucleotide-binding universal stress UspA family protein
MKILVPVDGSENSRSALWEVARRKWEETAQVKIIHVVENPVPITDVMGVNAEIARDAHIESVRKGREILDESEKIIGDQTGGNLNVSSEIITAEPFHSAAEEIVRTAEREGADLIVMGSRGLSLWKRLLLGSVSSAVVQHAPCSVEIVRPKRLVAEQEG